MVLSLCCQPAHADEPAPDAAVPRPSAVVLRIQGHLVVAERAGLKALLGMHGAVDFPDALRWLWRGYPVN